MAEEPDNLVLQLLRDMRREQTETRALQAKQAEALARIEQRIEEVHETMYSVAGFAMHANVRHETVTGRLKVLEERVSHLEEKV